MGNPICVKWLKRISASENNILVFVGFLGSCCDMFDLVYDWEKGKMNNKVFKHSNQWGIWCSLCLWKLIWWNYAESLLHIQKGLFWYEVFSWNGEKMVRFSNTKTCQQQRVWYFTWFLCFRSSANIHFIYKEHEASFSF